MVLFEWSAPNLKAVPSADFASIASAPDDFQTLNGECALFNDARYDKQLNNSTLYTGNFHHSDFVELNANFDGTALYTKLTYPYTTVASVLSESKGLFFKIPHRGYTGWICTHYFDNRFDVECVSRFISTSDFYAFLDDELTAPQDSDDPETNGVSLENGNWVCGTPSYDSARDELTVECTAWLPAESVTSSEPAIYRF